MTEMTLARFLQNSLTRSVSSRAAAAQYRMENPMQRLVKSAGLEDSYGSRFSKSRMEPKSPKKKSKKKEHKSPKKASKLINASEMKTRLHKIALEETKHSVQGLRVKKKYNDAAITIQAYARRRIAVANMVPRLLEHKLTLIEKEKTKQLKSIRKKLKRDKEAAQQEADDLQEAIDTGIVKEKAHEIKKIIKSLKNDNAELMEQHEKLSKNSTALRCNNKTLQEHMVKLGERQLALQEYHNGVEAQHLKITSKVEDYEGKIKETSEDLAWHTNHANYEHNLKCIYGIRMNRIRKLLKKEKEDPKIIQTVEEFCEIVELDSTDITPTAGSKAGMFRRQDSGISDDDDSEAIIDTSNHGAVMRKIPKGGSRTRRKSSRGKERRRSRSKSLSKVNMVLRATSYLSSDDDSSSSDSD